MRYEHVPAPYRQIYWLLLRFYPKPYRERFGQGLEQTFNDLCRERTMAGKGLFTFFLWVFGDTCIGMMSVRISYIFSFIVMHYKHVLRPVLITALILAIPFIAMRFTQEVNWTGSDFLIMGIVVFGFALAYELISRLSRNTMYRSAVGIAVVTSFLLYWVNLAVQIIGDGENPATLLYMFVPWVGLIGAALARFKARGMANAAFATAAAQMLVPVIGLIVWAPSTVTWGSPGVLGIFMLTAGFALLYAFSGVLFRQVGSTH